MTRNERDLAWYVGLYVLATGVTYVLWRLGVR